MTYKRHWLLSWGGTLGDGQDIWTNNLRLMNDNAGATDSVSDGQMEELLDGYVADIRTFINGANAFIHNTVTCSWVKFNEIGPDGRYVNQSKTFARYLSTATTTAPNGVILGTGNNSVPTFQSVCITMTTARQRGPASKGRLFLPMCGPALGATGFIPSATQTLMANHAATFIRNIANEGGLDETDMKPGVISNIGEPGPQEAITGVRVGNVPDVISRRKNSVAEVYVSAAV